MRMLAADKFVGRIGTVSREGNIILPVKTFRGLGFFLSTYADPAESLTADMISPVLFPL